MISFHPPSEIWHSHVCLKGLITFINPIKEPTLAFANCIFIYFWILLISIHFLSFIKQELIFCFSCVEIDVWAWDIPFLIWISVCKFPALFCIPWVFIYKIVITCYIPFGSKYFFSFLTYMLFKSLFLLNFQTNGLFSILSFKIPFWGFFVFCFLFLT